MVADGKMVELSGVPVDKNLHHSCVCMVTSRYPCYGKGTGVLVKYKGYFSIVAGFHLIPTAVAARNSVVEFAPNGAAHPIQVSLRPAALFEVLGTSNIITKTLAVAACDQSRLPVSVRPAVLAPIEYNDAVSCFLRAGSLSPPPPRLPPACERLDPQALSGETQVLPGRSNRRKARSRQTESKFPPTDAPPQDVSRKRRGALIPGTRAAKRPGVDEEPFEVTVDRESGTIRLELVARVHGAGNGAYRVDVIRQDVQQQFTENQEEGCLGKNGDIAVVVMETSALDGVHGAPLFLGGMLYAFALQEHVGQSVTTAVTASSVLDTPPPCVKPLTKRLYRNEEAEGEEWKARGWRGIQEKTAFAARLSGGCTHSGSADTLREPDAREHTLSLQGAKAMKRSDLGGKSSVPVTTKETFLVGIQAVIPGKTGNERRDNVQRQGRDPSISFMRDSFISKTYTLSKAFERQGLEEMVKQMVHLFEHGTAEAMELEVERVSEDTLRALRTADGRSLVHLAAMSARLTPLEFVRTRLGMDVASTEADGSGSTALHIAAYTGRIKSMEYLLAQGGDLLKKNKAGLTPAMLAALTGQREVLQWLLEHTDSFGGGGIFLDNNKAGHDVLDLVMDMDEAAVYGSPIYTMLENIFSLDGNREGESSADEDDNKSKDGRSSSSTPNPPNNDRGLDSDELLINTDEAWEKYVTGNMSTREFVGMLSRIHGEGLRAAWPRILAGVSGTQTCKPQLMANMDVERRIMDREKAEQKAKARLEANLARIAAKHDARQDTPADNREHSHSRGQVEASPGAEEVCLRSSAAKYLRGKIDSEVFYMRLKACMGGKRADAAVLRMAKGIPEEKKACALMQDYRSRRHQCRIAKRKGRRARGKAAFSPRDKKGKTAGSVSADDNSSVASIFSVGSSVGSTSVTAGKGPDFEDAMVMFQRGRMTSVQLFTLLQEAFGQQTARIVPGVLASVTSKHKRAELAKLYDLHGAPRDKSNNVAFRRRLKNDPRTVPRGSGERGKSTVGGRLHDTHDSKWGEDWGFQTAAGEPFQDEGDQELLGAVVVNTTRPSPFSARATGWSGDANKSSPVPNGNRDNDRHDIDETASSDEEAEAEQPPAGRDGETKKSVQKLMNGFAAGTLAVPHFFGAMLESFGEEKLLKAMPDILKVLPEHKAAELDEFVAAAEGQAGAAAKARGAARETALKQQEREQKKERQGLKDQEDAGNARPLEDDNTNRESNTTEAEGDGPDGIVGDAMEQAEKRKKDIHQWEDDIEGPSGMGQNGNMVENDDSRRRRDDHNKEENTAATAAAASRKQKGEKRGTITGRDEKTKHGKGIENQHQPRYVMTEAEQERYDRSFEMMLSEDRPSNDDHGDNDPVEAIATEKAVAALSKSGLPPETLSKIWELLAVPKTQQTLTKAEWAIAMHLVLCVAVEKLPLPEKLPRGLLLRKGQDGGTSSNEGKLHSKSLQLAEAKEKDLREEKQQQKKKGATGRSRTETNGAKTTINASGMDGKAREVESKHNKRYDTTGSKKHNEDKKKEKRGVGNRTEGNGDVHKRGDGEKPSPPPAAAAAAMDLKTATRNFKTGELSATEFLPALQRAFGDKLADVWPTLLERLPEERAQELAAVPGINYDKPGKPKKTSSAVAKEFSLSRQVGLKEATSAFKAGEIGARAYHDDFLKTSLGDKLPEMLPKLLQALPRDRASALKAVSTAAADGDDDDEDAPTTEDELDPWTMTLQDRSIYDKAFLKLDKDRNGVLSRSEARPLLLKAVGELLTQSQLAEVWTLADLSGDDHMTREEWAIAYHLVRCITQRCLKVPSALPNILRPTTSGNDNNSGRLPPVPR